MKTKSLIIILSLVGILISCGQTNGVAPGASESDSTSPPSAGLSLTGAVTTFADLAIVDQLMTLERQRNLITPMASQAMGPIFMWQILIITSFERLEK